MNAGRTMRRYAANSLRLLLKALCGVCWKDATVRVPDENGVRYAYCGECWKTRRHLFGK